VNATPRQDPLGRLRTQLAALPGLPPADRARREAAFARFFELGFPAANDEDWKYTSLRRLESRSFASAVRRDVAASDLPTLVPIDARRVLIVDGFLHDEASRPWPDGVQRLQTPADAGWIERSLHWPTGGGTERFVALNAAFASDPLLLSHSFNSC